MTETTFEFLPYPNRRDGGHGRRLSTRIGLALLATAMTWFPPAGACADDLEFSSLTSPGKMPLLKIFLPKGADMELSQSVIGPNTSGYDVHAVVREWKSPSAKPTICLLRSGPYKIAHLNPPSDRTISITLVIPDQNGSHIASFKYFKDYPAAQPTGLDVRIASDALIGGPGTHQELKAHVIFSDGKNLPPFASSSGADTVYNGIVPDNVVVGEALAPDGAKEC